MRDEEKTKDQLIRELQLLRKQLIDCRFPETEPDEAGKWKIHEDLHWNPDDPELPMVEESAFGQSVEQPSVDPDSAVGEHSYSGSVTETGSFDLRWLTVASFAKFLNAIPMPVLLVGEDGFIEFGNLAFSKAFGEDEREKLVHMNALCNRDESVGICDVVKCTLRERSAQVLETRLDMSKGEMWARMHFRSLRFGRRRSALVLIEDLTTEKREVALNRKYGTLVSIFPMGIAEFRIPRPVSPNMPADELLALILKAEMIEGNRSFANLHGCKDTSPLQGRTLKEIFDPGEGDLEYYRQWMENRFYMVTFESKSRGCGQDLKYWENALVGNPQEGTMTQFWVMKQDITERKLVHQELVDKLKTIDDLYEHIIQSEKARAIAEHTAKVAHELRQPLTIIGGFSRRIAKDAPPALDSKTDFVQIIMKEVQRLEKILGRLIDFTKRDSVTLNRVSPNEIIEYVVRINEELVRQKRIDLKLDLDADIGEVSLDADRFQQVVRNLISNAVEASPEDGIVKIQTSIFTPSDKVHESGELTAKSYFELKIRNSGISIPEEVLDRVFDPFFTTKSYGTGLGLTLAKKIVEDHDGSISVKSDDDGTIFTVWMPITPR